MKKQWKLDNKGMTLLEVIVAFAIFAIAATILITGFNGALRIMGNSAIIKDTSQANASGIESGSPLDTIEGATVTTLEKPKYLSFSIKDLSFTINGAYQIASAPKRNDGLTMSMVAFKVDDLTPPAVPSPPVKESETDMVPAVPTLNSNEAYYNPDPRKEVEEQDPDNSSIINKVLITYFEKYTGILKNGSFNDNSYYIKEVGKNLHKGVVTVTVQKYNTALTIAGPDDHLRQLFFTNQIPFELSGAGAGLMYVTDFIYLGNNGKDNINSPTIIKTYGNQYNHSSLIFRSYFNMDEEKLDPYKVYEDHTALIYLPKKLEIQVYGNQSFEGKFSEFSIPAGYYEVPCGTDIIKITYDKNEFEKYTLPKSEKSDSYQRTYEDVKQRLSDSKVIMVKEQ
ncbi:prepilin-type N-terminal cleavage/methylation domain-containing protein [Eubacterium limosum]|uniref:prepilin-type N-terminal cleavage/methylation domain-containing protein n=1 Tax=Eubacterium limosum TaxID=1736 RepID=UPI0037177A6F